MIKYLKLLIIAGLVLIASSAWGQQFTPGLEYNNQPGLAAVKVYTGSASNPSAFDSGYTGNGVKIGVVDTGLNPSHVEFTNAIVSGLGWKRTSAELLTTDNWVSVTGTGNFSSFLKDVKADGTTVDGHGSHVSSIAAGRMDGVNRTGNMMGAAYKSQLVVGTLYFNQCETFDAEGKCTQWKASGLNDTQISQTINYVSNQGVKVINNSWGMQDGGADPAKEHADFKAESPNTVAALKTALGRGAVIVFANGNDRDKPGKGANPGAPAAMPTYDTAIAAYGAWITVAATNNAGTAITNYSHYCGVAKNYCIAAPGGLANDATGMNGADANKNEGSVYMFGTSMAAPVVSGTVALVAEKYPWMTNRNLTTTILTTGSTALSPTTEMGRGLLDVSKAINGPAIFEEDFEANVTTGLSSTFSNNISGAYGLKKLGAGTLTLTKDNTYAGGTTINAGTLAVNNPNKVTGSGTGTGNVTVAVNGKLGGTGRVAGNVRNFGHGNPGNSVGSLTIGGTYIQEDSGGLDIEISSTDHDVLEVEGKVSLSGELSTILLDGYRPNVGSRFTIVNATGVTGQFSSLDTAVNAAGTMYFKPKYLSAQVDIVLERDYAFNLSNRGFSLNQQSVGGMLNSVANTAAGISGDLNTVLNAIDNLASDNQVAAALDQIAPRGDMASVVMTQNDARIQTANISGRLQDLRSGMQGVSLRGLNFTIEQDEELNRHGRPVLLAFNGDTLPEVLRMEGNENWGIFATGNATAGRMKDTSPQSDGTFRNAGVTVGTDYRFTRNLIAGIMAGYNRTRSNLDTLGSTAAISAYTLGAYGTYYRQGFYVDGLVNYGWNNADKDRRIVYPGVDRTAASDQSGQTWTVSGGAGYDYPWQDWIFTPKIMVDYIHLATGDYTESGADSLNLQVNGQNSKVLLGQIGGSVTYVWKTDKATVLPRLWAMYGRELDAPDSIGTTARLAMGSSSFTVFSIPPDQSFLNLGAGVTATFPKGTSLYLNLAGQVGQSNYYAYNLSAGLRVPF